MDVILHPGCHRTASETLRAAMRQNPARLAEAGLVVWGPNLTRNRLFRGAAPDEISPLVNPRAQLRHAEHRVQECLRKATRRGARCVLISDPDLLGSVKTNLQDEELYPQAGARLRQYAKVFGRNQIKRVALSIRAQDTYWQSAIAQHVLEGGRIPGPRKLRAIVAAARSWRHVVSDIHAALPRAEIVVLPYESHQGEADMFLRYGARLDMDLEPFETQLHPAPDLQTLRQALQERGQDPDQLPDEDGLWQPFSTEQATKLQELWADDLFWFAAGADGIATLTDEEMALEKGKRPTAPAHRGHDNDEQERLDKAS